MALPERNSKLITDGMRLIIEGLGCDLNHDNFKKTPERVAKLYGDVLDGNFATLPNEKMTKFPSVTYNGMVMITNIPFYSFCAHHFLPFYGRFSVGYIPSKEHGVIGISKLVRIVRHQAKVPTTQEELTAAAAKEVLRITGGQMAGVWIECEHMCMSLRGVKSPGALTVTHAMELSEEASTQTQDECLAIHERFLTEARVKR